MVDGSSLPFIGSHLPVFGVGLGSFGCVVAPFTANLVVQKPGRGLRCPMLSFRLTHDGIGQLAASPRPTVLVSTPDEPRSPTQFQGARACMCTMCIPSYAAAGYLWSSFPRMSRSFSDWLTVHSNPDPTVVRNQYPFGLVELLQISRS